MFWTPLLSYNLSNFLHYYPMFSSYGLAKKKYGGAYSCKFFNSYLNKWNGKMVYQKEQESCKICAMTVLLWDFFFRRQRTDHSVCNLKINGFFFWKNKLIFYYFNHSALYLSFNPSKIILQLFCMEKRNHTTELIWNATRRKELSRWPLLMKDTIESA